MAEPERRVDLLGTAEVLHGHLSQVLCQEIFEKVRKGERRRLWTLWVLAQFWTAVILRAPRSLTHALALATGGQGGFPRTGGSSQGFFERSKTLSVKFFAALFDAFQEAVWRDEPACFASAHAPVVERFGRVFVLDGSTLDQVARRLKILWDDPRIPLPGSVVALYDLARGSLARLHFDRYGEGKEQLGARRVLAKLPAGSLCIADALYGLPHFFETVAKDGVYGLCRRNRRAKLDRVRMLSSQDVGKAHIEDWLVVLGRPRNAKRQQVRWIRWQEGSETLELYTNVLDPERLSAAEAVALYRARWTVERLFYDLKEVLNLNRVYAGNFNAVGMQVYASAIVHTAMRAAQGRIATAHTLTPEDLSPAKLFPKLAAASASLTTAELTFEATCEANPSVRLVKPDWKEMAFSSTTLASVLVERRTGVRRRRPLRTTDQRRRLPRPPAQPP